MSFKPTNSYVANLFINHGDKGGLNSFFSVLSSSKQQSGWSGLGIIFERRIEIPEATYKP